MSPRHLGIPESVGAHGAGPGAQSRVRQVRVQLVLEREVEFQDGLQAEQAPLQIEDLVVLRAVRTDVVDEAVEQTDAASQFSVGAHQRSGRVLVVEHRPQHRVDGALLLDLVGEQVIDQEITGSAQRRQSLGSRQLVQLFGDDAQFLHTDGQSS
jgi:hypothetical protein